MLLKQQQQQQPQPQQQQQQQAQGQQDGGITDHHQHDQGYENESHSPTASYHQQQRQPPPPFQPQQDYQQPPPQYQQPQQYPSSQIAAGDAIASPPSMVPFATSEPTAMAGDLHSRDPAGGSVQFANMLSSIGLQIPMLTFQPPAVDMALTSGDQEVGQSQSQGTRGEDDPIIIPVGHQTTTGSLFSLEPIQTLIGEYPNDFFYQIESLRSSIPQLESAPDVASTLKAIQANQEHSRSLISAFFTSMHPSFPVLDETCFTTFFKKAIHGDADDICDVGLCLVILALGELVPRLAESRDFSPDEEIPGMEYFSVAHRILVHQWVVGFSPIVSLPAGLVFASLYLSYLTKPLPAWRLAYMASSKLQVLSKSTTRTPSALGSHVTERLCWTCFLLECDTLAELHLPRSGIEVTIDCMDFPGLDDLGDRYGLMFLALCSIRRLLNRIHNAIYASNSNTGGGRRGSMVRPGSSGFTAGPVDVFARSPGSASTMASLESMVNELARQLESWYFYLPHVVKPDLSHNVPRDKLEVWLRLRYWSAKHIISRPCLIYMATTTADQGQPPPYVLEYSKICVESCRNYLETASYVLKERTQYTWMTIKACLSAVLVLVLASRSPSLQHLVPDIANILDNVLVMVKPWATPDSSAESVVWILQTMARKQKLMHFRLW
ncbi:hypothetical protein A1O3_10460 [Capronia epimyces CBS 606.96]|uniref:Transcription factor domain-containing protein n=1 Tax=Capronia epimyces CBS 606.96 TaxID=1182542 RepID=W9XA04_9EURO|nr:uncharacterized protein A1O3_10460 [Capronia epimyces CBS 606.96]EXJ77302.1 hypothetical protein A1O3_10460 [Capronia epimyces CBS 606.96]